MYSGVENTGARCVCTGVALMAGAGLSRYVPALSHNHNFTGPWGEVSPTPRGTQPGLLGRGGRLGEAFSCSSSATAGAFC